MSSLDTLIDTLIQTNEPPKQGYLTTGDFHAKNSQAFFGDDHCKKIYEQDPKRFKSEVRAVGKVAGLALVYGSSYKMFLDIIPNCTDAQAKAIYNNFFNALPKLAQWMKQQKHLGMTEGYVKSILGRRYHIDGFDSDEWWLKSKAERSSYNTGIQGSGSDIIKMILLKAFNLMDKHKLSRFIGTYAFDGYYTRVLSLPESELTNQTLIQALENQPQGNCKIIITDETGKPKYEWDKNIQVTRQMLQDFKFEVIL